MGKAECPTDRSVLSTENNGYAGDERDENLWDENIWENQIPEDDRIPEAVHENGVAERPVYDEEDYWNEPGQ